MSQIEFDHYCDDPSLFGWVLPSFSASPVSFSCVRQDSMDGSPDENGEQHSSVFEGSAGEAVDYFLYKQYDKREPSVSPVLYLASSRPLPSHTPFPFVSRPHPLPPQLHSSNGAREICAPLARAHADSSTLAPAKTGKATTTFKSEINFGRPRQQASRRAVRSPESDDDGAHAVLEPAGWPRSYQTALTTAATHGGARTPEAAAPGELADEKTNVRKEPAESLGEEVERQRKRPRKAEAEAAGESPQPPRDGVHESGRGTDGQRPTFDPGNADSARSSPPGDVSAAKPASPKLKGSEGPKNAGSKKPSQGPASPSRASKKFVKFLYELEEQGIVKVLSWETMRKVRGGRGGEEGDEGEGGGEGAKWEGDGLAVPSPDGVKGWEVLEVEAWHTATRVWCGVKDIWSATSKHAFAMRLRRMGFRPWNRAPKPATSGYDFELRSPDATRHGFEFVPEMLDRYFPI